VTARFRKDALGCIPSIIVFTALAVVPLLVRTTYILHFIILFFIYAILSLSWNILGGYAGQVNLGHSAFFGIGAYTLGLLWLHGTTPIWISFVLAGVMATAFGLVLIPCFKLRGVYFAIGTLALNETLRVIMINWQDVTGGSSGLRLPTPPIGFSLLPYYYLGLGFFIITILISSFLAKSKFGLAFKSIRENEDAALMLGVHTLKYKVLALCVCAFLAGEAGALNAYYITYIEPYSIFGMTWTVCALFGAILGGVATIPGPIIGACIFLALSELFLGFAEVNLLITGGLLIVVMLLFPEGLMGLVRLRRVS